MNAVNASSIQSQIAKGLFHPNVVLTNMAMAYFQAQDAYVAKQLFPILPVQLSTAAYYVFERADLARDNVRRKPALGRVAPTIISNHLETYSVAIDQILLGIDQIAQTNIQRQPVPGASDPRKAKTRTIAEQMNIHQDIIFADGFFKAGVWTDEWTGGASYTPDSHQFIKFSDANCNPIKLFDDLRTRMKKRGRRAPNKLGLGEDAFNALKENPIILDHVKYGGSTANPAIVNENVLAEMFGLDKVSVFGSTYNKADFGQEEDMEFICSPDSALLVYATDSPAVDEPSAGYMFTWDMLGDGNYMPVLQYPGENGSHAEFIEGLMGVSTKKTADDLGTFLKECV
jgi:hypothetical protein